MPNFTFFFKWHTLIFLLLLDIWNLLKILEKNSHFLYQNLTFFKISYVEFFLTSEIYTKKPKCTVLFEIKKNILKSYFTGCSKCPPVTFRQQWSSWRKFFTKFKSAKNHGNFVTYSYTVVFLWDLIKKVKRTNIGWYFDLSGPLRPTQLPGNCLTTVNCWIEMFGGSTVSNITRKEFPSFVTLIGLPLLVRQNLFYYSVHIIVSPLEFQYARFFK